MTVCSLTPSRMGIITLRRVWSKRSVTGLNLAGISLGNWGYVAGGWVLSWALAGKASASAKTDTRNGTARTRGFMMGPPVLKWPRWHDMPRGMLQSSRSGSGQPEGWIVVHGRFKARDYEEEGLRFSENVGGTYSHGRPAPRGG